MRALPTIALVALGGSAALLAGCSTGGPPLPPAPPITVAAPVIPAYVLGEPVGGRSARVRKARAAGVRPLTQANLFDYVARQEIDLRRQTAGTGVDVIRAGEVLLLRLPASQTFDVGQSAIRPQALSTLTEIGLTLKRFNQSLVDVLGHTDSTGNPANNQALSERRAQAVAAHLRTRGVVAGRIATKGYAATQPLASDANEEGRALNRRVEIKLTPVR